MKKPNKKIAVIGLGYVGLPLALSFAEKYTTIGYDQSKERIKELDLGYDKNKEVNKSELKKSTIKFSNLDNDLFNCNYFIICVPTPVFKNKKINLRNIINATRLVKKYINVGSTVIYESTVYPGCTEEVCLPILQKSGLKYNEDFYLGYSPERINPGDKEHNIKNITKIVSGSNNIALNKIEKLYSSIIKAKIFRANSIKIAEAAKAIENTQRDINIAFMNEITKIFDKAKIDTYEVLEAAKTKWNFLNFRPGFVGGHCISVDPFYLNHLAIKNKVKTKIILNGRNVNDSMSEYIFKKVNKLLKHSNKKILILGYTFKENCADYRNSMAESIFNKLYKKYKKIKISDPHINNNFPNNNFENFNNIKIEYYDLILLLVKHKEFKKIDFSGYLDKNKILYDFHNFLMIKNSIKF